jgi:hypothetical protein
MPGLVMAMNQHTATKNAVMDSTEDTINAMMEILTAVMGNLSFILECSILISLL